MGDSSCNRMLSVQRPSSELDKGKGVLPGPGWETGGDRLPSRERGNRRRDQEALLEKKEEAVLDGSDRQAAGGILCSRVNRQGAPVHKLGLETARQPRALGKAGGLRLHQNQHEMERLGLH